MKLRGIDLVEARNFKYSISAGFLECSCIGNGCTLRAKVSIGNFDIEKLILECKYVFADEIDPIFVEEEYYKENDYDLMLESSKQRLDSGQSVEASNWQIHKNDDLYFINCCEKCGQKEYKSAKEAIDSLCVWPDRTYSRKVSWRK